VAHTHVELEAGKAVGAQLLQADGNAFLRAGAAQQLAQIEFASVEPYVADASAPFEPDAERPPRSGSSKRSTAMPCSVRRCAIRLAANTSLPQVKQWANSA
jgi:hypothetical protein